jgi:hypothetical protein
VCLQYSFAPHLSMRDLLLLLRHHPSLSLFELPHLKDSCGPTNSPQSLFLTAANTASELAYRAGLPRAYRLSLLSVYLDGGVVHYICRPVAAPCTRLPRISQHCPASFPVLEQCLRLIRAMRRCAPEYLKIRLPVHCLIPRSRSPGSPKALVSPSMDRYNHPNKDIYHTRANEVQYSTCDLGVIRPTRPRQYRCH